MPGTKTNGVESATDNPGWILLQRKVRLGRISQVFELFRENNIEPILFKGFAVDLFYPKFIYRDSIDVDIAVSRDDFFVAQEISVSNEAKGLAIDVHRELRHLDTLGWDDLFINSELIELDGVHARVLRAEDHLRVLCVHWLNDGGINRERLWDVYYLVANRETNFDWERFLGPVSDNRRRWLVCTLGLAQKYLGLDLSQTPLSQAKVDIPDWLIRTVESEWSSEIKSVPLEVVLSNSKLFFRQLGKRLRPNAIRSTIEMEGSFDARTRFFYHIASMIKRIPDTYRRISRTLFSRSK